MGEVLTKLTVWTALAAYGAGAVAYLYVGGSAKRDGAARICWTLAWLSLLAHAACAFQFYHRWSHAAALADTARQTQEAFGVPWGGGLHVNYALFVLWGIDLAWWWRRGVSAYRRRYAKITLAWHAFLIFIFFNATVVFETGAVRWVGLGLLTTLAILWWRFARVQDRDRENVNQE